MSFFDKAKGLAKGVADTALNNAQLVAQAAGNTGRGVSDRVREAVVEAAYGVEEFIENRRLEPLPAALTFFLENETARVLLADAIASAESEAHEDTTWDEIVKAALLDLKSTPAGSA